MTAYEILDSPAGMDYYDFNERAFLVCWEIAQSCPLVCSCCRAEAQPRRRPKELNNVDFAKLKAAEIQRMSLRLDGATRETHDSFRSAVGTYDRTIETVRRAHAVSFSLQIGPH